MNLQSLQAVTGTTPSMPTQSVEPRYYTQKQTDFGGAYSLQTWQGIQTNRSESLGVLIPELVALLESCFICGWR